MNWIFPQIHSVVSGQALPLQMFQIDLFTTFGAILQTQTNNRFQKSVTNHLFRLAYPPLLYIPPVDINLDLDPRLELVCIVSTSE